MRNLDTLRKLPFAPVVGAMFGVVAAILVVATPPFLFERAITGSGLPELLSAAAPPLGGKARVLAAFVSAAVIGALVFGALKLIEKATARKVPLTRGSTIVAARLGAGLERVHVNPPKPIFAGSDLGAPFMSDEAVTVAYEELMLDPAMIEAASPAPMPLPAAARPMPLHTVEGLMAHLEEAVARRRLRAGRTPPAPGDMASLRAALGIPIAA